MIYINVTIYTLCINGVWLCHYKCFILWVRCGPIGHLETKLKWKWSQCFWEPVCFGRLSPEALCRWTVVTMVGWGRKHCSKDGEGKSSLSSLHKQKMRWTKWADHNRQNSNLLFSTTVLPLDWSPEPDARVGEDAEEEASWNTWQEGGGQNHVATGHQGALQRHTARVHVDWAGGLLHHTLHPAVAVHFHLDGSRQKQIEDSRCCWDHSIAVIQRLSTTSNSFFTYFVSYLLLITRADDNWFFQN